VKELFLSKQNLCQSHSLGRTAFGKPGNKNKVLSREEANALLNDWVKNDRLKLHMLQVAHLMKCWAKEKEQLDEQEQWKWNLPDCCTMLIGISGPMIIVV